jgi:hypothetical protein
VLERTLEEPPAKRKPGWLKEIVQEAERIVLPKELSGKGRGLIGLEAMLH